MTDPIFAAIERHRIAERKFGETITVQDKLQEELPEHLRQSDIRPPEVSEIIETDDPRWIAAERAHQAALEKEGECAEALLDIRPTTLEGLLALLRYAEKADAGRDWPDQIASAAAEALEAIKSGEPEETESDDPRFGMFGKAYKEWLEARADIEKLNARGYVSDEEARNEDPDAVCERIMDRLSAAERQLVFQPVTLAYQLIQKFGTLQTMMSDRERDGCPNDNRHMLMLASVKADLCRFRFERPPRE
jgi:hypothetical protein